MRKGLNRSTKIDGINGTLQVNVYENKKIVFTGSKTDAARFIGMPHSAALTYYINNKSSKIVKNENGIK